ncbi:MAG: ribosomal protein S17 [Kiritimatiellia bacterium]|jgi:ribosomal protein S17
MKIDLSSLTYDELLELNHKIVERLKFLDTLHTHEEMMQFSPGDKVSFQPTGRERQVGTLVKFNKKTVTVITEAGQKWNISPQMLSKVKKVKPQKGGINNVIDLKKKV